MRCSLVVEWPGGHSRPTAKADFSVQGCRPRLSKCLSISRAKNIYALRVIKSRRESIRQWTEALG